MTLEIYDPAMCCSTGVCGPSVDHRLIRLAADVAFLKGKGVSVERYNLGHQPEEFTKSALVLAELGDEAQNLPVFLVDGELKSKARYPDRTELAAWFGLEVTNSSEKPRKMLTMAHSGCCSSDSGGEC